MKKSTVIRLFASLVASNIGIALLSYSGYKLGWWDNQTLWRMLFADGVYFCLGSVGNAMSLAVDVGM